MANFNDIRIGQRVSIKEGPHVDKQGIVYGKFYRTSDTRALIAVVLHNDTGFVRLINGEIDYFLTSIHTFEAGNLHCHD